MNGAMSASVELRTTQTEHITSAIGPIVNLAAARAPPPQQASRVSSGYPLGKLDGHRLGDAILEAEITARTSGELFFFVNDLLPISAVFWNFYAGNRGEALVSVTPVTQSR
jgi:hypothetical protein